MKGFRAVLIDPFARRVSEQMISPADEIGQISQLIRSSAIALMHPGVSSGTLLYGRLVQDIDEAECFYIGGVRIAGCALYVGNRGHDFGDSPLSASEVAEQVSFFEASFRQWLESLVAQHKVASPEVFTFESRNDGIAVTIAYTVSELVDGFCALSPDTRERFRSAFTYSLEAGTELRVLLRQLGEYITDKKLYASQVDDPDSGVIGTPCRLSPAYRAASVSADYHVGESIYVDGEREAVITGVKHLTDLDKDAYLVEYADDLSTDIILIETAARRISGHNEAGRVNASAEKDDMKSS
jgi:hypothetical protein